MKCINGFMGSLYDSISKIEDDRPIDRFHNKLNNIGCHICLCEKSGLAHDLLYLVNQGKKQEFKYYSCDSEFDGASFYTQDDYIKLKFIKDSVMLFLRKKRLLK